MLKKIFLNRAVFKTVYIVLLLINIIPFVNDFAAFELVVMAFAAWGFVLLAYDIFKNGLYSFKRRAFLPIAVFFFFCALSLVINYENGLVRNMAMLAIFFLCAGILYITASDNKDVLAKEVLSVAKAYTVVSGLFSVASLVMYFTQFYYMFTRSNGTTKIRLGVAENRLFGIFTSPNVGGAIMAIGIFVGIGMLLYMHKKQIASKLWCVITVICIVLQVWFISLTLSRGTYLSLAAASVCILLIGFEKSKSTLAAILKRAAVYACSVAVFLILLYGLRFASVSVVSLLDSAGIVEQKVTGFDRVEYASAEKETTDTNKSTNTQKTTPETNTNTATNNTAKPTTSTTAQKTDTTAKTENTEKDKTTEDISNKRFSIWKSAFNLAKDKLLFGTGKYYQEYLNHHKEKTWLTKEDHTYLIWAAGNTHNGYLQILVDAGLFALISFFALLIWCLISNIRAYFKATNTEKTVMAACLAAVVFVLVDNLFETNMALMGTNPIQAMFWFAAGVDMTLCAIINKRKDPDKLKKVAYFCATPLHIINAVNMLTTVDSGKKADIFVYNHFSDSQRVTDALKSSGMFERVTHVDDNVLSAKSKIKRALHAFIPSRIVRSVIGKNFCYQKVVFFVLDPLTLTHLMDDAEECEFYYGEDGLGSYISESLYQPSSIAAILLKITGRNRLLDKIRGIYLHAPDMRTANMQYEGKVIDTVSLDDPKMSEITNTLWPCDTSLLDPEKSVVFFEEPFVGENKEPSERLANITVDKLTDAFGKQKIYVKKHPRNDVSTASEDIIMPCAVPYERLMGVYDQNKMLLVSGVCTAAVQPMLISGDKPVTIFLYRLLFGDDSKYDVWDSFFEKLSETYSLDGSLFIPRTEQEFDAAIKKASQLLADRD